MEDNEFTNSYAWETNCRLTAYFGNPAWLDSKYMIVQFFLKKQKDEKHITISLIIFSYTQFLIF